MTRKLKTGGGRGDKRERESLDSSPPTWYTVPHVYDMIGGLERRKAVLELELEGERERQRETITRF